MYLYTPYKKRFRAKCQILKDLIVSYIITVILFYITILLLKCKRSRSARYVELIVVNNILYH